MAVVSPVYGSNGVVGEHDQAITRGPTIIVGRKGSVGEVHFSAGPCWPIDTTYFVDEFPECSPAEYWTLYLKSLRLGVQEKSSAIPGISREDIYELRVAVPPVKEQQRIVAKLEELLAKVETCQQRLAKIPAILKRFRQSVLAAGCSGRLTAEWRARDNEENALADGWKWIPLEGLLEKGGIFDGPFGSNLKTEDYTNSGVRVIRLENIGHLKFFGDKETYITKKKYGSLIKHTVGSGDIIFSSFIADEIRACVLPRLATTAIAKADCFCLRPDRKVVNRSYLTFQLVSQQSYSKLIESVHGATRPRINTSQLRKLQIRICPLEEQRLIVSRVETLFKLAGELEARYKKAQAQVEALNQAILVKAFRGALVPTEAELARREGRDQEPASALLERIGRTRRDSAEASTAAKENRLQERRITKGSGRRK